MKKIILSLIIGISLISCETKNVEIQTTETSINGCLMRTYTIDSCEYIGSVNGGNADFIAHKGNCKFCKARRIAEMYSILKSNK